MIPNNLLVQLNKLLPITTALPKFTQLSSKLLPKAVQEIVLKKVFNHIFAKAIIDGELAFLQDKTLAIIISDLNDCTLLVNVDNDKVQVTLTGNTQADVSITGTLNSFILLASQQVDPDTLFFKRQLTITGNTDLGLQIKNFLDTIELDELPVIFEQVFMLYHQETQAA